MRQPPADPADSVKLVISDVDGTLVTPDKTLTPAAHAAVQRLAQAGIGFTLISSRPPRGMAPLISQLGVSLPFAAFNGGTLAAPDLTLLEAHRLSADAARQALAILEENTVQAWVFADATWRLRDAEGANVARERRTVGFDPTVVTGFEDVIDRIDKLVGVSNDVALMARVEKAVQGRLAGHASIILSQPVYLDITHPKANKGDGVAALASRIGVDLAHTAVIGDMFNDVAMFDRAGFSVAMGQSPEAVKARADWVSLANTEDGFARAVDQIIKRSPEPPAQ